ncbi:MAG: arginine--tRNA ligase [bacterium]|nr:arginine--tRNA ligase [bacterium]
MTTIKKTKQNIVGKINKALGGKVKVHESDLILPPDVKMGDLSFPLFNLAKEVKANPAQLAGELAQKIKPCSTVKEIKAVGPYLNFILQEKKLVQGVLAEISNQPKTKKTGKTIMLEFAHPNTHKAFHIGHLRNIVTGESLARILEHAGHKVVRANYQGDVGMHIAKCLWGVTQLSKELVKAEKGAIDAKVAFLGKAYAYGSENFEKNKKKQAEIIEFNKRIYDADESIKKLYSKTRQWSLDYFDKIYQRVLTKFDRLYFESETFQAGKKIVLDCVKRGVFKESEGAIIFEGDKHGLHNRVFINSEGYPTYEAKDMALAKLQFQEYHPEKIIHVVGPEQIEYFKVIFRALEYVLPQSKDKEIHLAYGWVRLKAGKMSSRLGNVILGEWLLDEVKKEILKLVKKSKEIKNQAETAEKISLAAVKFSILKNGLTRDIAFDINESINLSGNSGPYILYTYARIQSILRKANKPKNILTAKQLAIDILAQEKSLAFKLAQFPEVTAQAAEKFEPSLIAKYLFELSQNFNDYYHQTPILKAEAEKAFRLALIEAVAQVVQQGSHLLGFETVEKM